MAHRSEGYRQYSRQYGIVKLLTLCGGCQDWTVAIAARYKGYRYPIEVIGHAVWLYHRFTLSLRDGRGTDARPRRRGHPRDDPVLVCEVRAGLRCPVTSAATPPRRQMDLWRAVDQHANVLDILVQSGRNAVAAKRFFRKVRPERGRGLDVGRAC